MGHGPLSDSEETVYPLSSEESVKSRVSFAKSLTHSLEEAAVIGGDGVSLRYPDVEEEATAGEASDEVRGSPLGAQEPMEGSGREEEMDHGVKSSEENASKDTEELEEGQVVGEDDEDEL